MSHTESPWSVLPGDTLSGHRQVGAATVGCPLQIVATVHAFEPGDTEATANARLIAAAPDLLQIVAAWGDLAPRLSQLLDGWHQDGTAWGEWDESVRRELGEVHRRTADALSRVML